MNNFYLTPQYELFVEAKLTFIINALMPLPMENLESLQSSQMINAIGMLTDTFSYHGTPYGNAFAGAKQSVLDQQMFNANYALDMVEAAGQALAWNSRQDTLSGELLRVLCSIFENRVSSINNPVATSSWGMMERIWRFLVTAPAEVLAVIGNMRYIVPVTPSVWREITETVPTQVTKTGLLNELYKDGFVWPNSPITFIPTTPFDDFRKNLHFVVVRPGNTQVLYQDGTASRMELVYSVMRELFGHVTSNVFRIPSGTDEALQQLTAAVIETFGSWDEVPASHFLLAIRELLNDFRCSDNRVTFDGARGGTVVGVIEFMDKLRVYQSEDKSRVGLDAVIQAFVDFIIKPNMSHFQMLRDAFPAFGNMR